MDLAKKFFLQYKSSCGLLSLSVVECPILDVSFSFRWVNVLTKAVRGEIDQDVQEEPADNNLSPKEPSSPHSLDSS